MPDLILRRRLAPGSVPHNIAMDGVPHATTTESVAAEIWWRFEDDPTMEPQLLGVQNAGHDLVVPFNLEGREIRLFVVSKTSAGLQSAREVREAVQTTFAQPEPPTLANVEYVSDATVELTIANNGGTGDINIWRSFEGEDFGIIDSVAYSTTLYQDTDCGIDGDYSYYLTQDDVTGVSNTLTDTVSGEGSPAGSPPSGLDGTYDGVTDCDLSWTNNSGTGLNYIERRLNPTGSWVTIGSVSSGTNTYTDTTVAKRPFAQTYYYRVRNASVAGYSNELSVYIEAE